MPFTDILAAFKWWVVVTAIGAIAFPIVHFLLKDLTDRGYAFSKLIGLLIISFSFWLFGSLGFLKNNLGGILLGILALGILSTWAFFKARESPAATTSLDWVKRNWKYIAIAELIFVAVFVFWVWVRSQNPSISGTEKPMEFAFLNSLSRSETFPPLDPWLSGFAISYYYFGYLMTSVIARLAAVPEPEAFNLAIAWLIAATALGAFGLVYNLISGGIDKVQRSAVMFGLIAAIAVPIAGNLEIGLEVLHANGIGSDSFWQWLDVRDLEPPATELETPRYETSQWWWWRSSRVIHEYHLSGRPEEGLEPIAEFPSFSFILGDLHAHVLALPYALLSLAVALAWWQRKGQFRLNIGGWFSGDGPLEQVKDLSRHDRALILFTALVLGGLSFLNTWDVFIHLFVVLGAFLLAQWRQTGRWRGEVVGLTITLALLLMFLAIVLYLPFYLGLRSQAGPPFLLPMVMKPTRLLHYLIIFAMPIIAVMLLVINLVVDFARKRERTWNVRAAGNAALITIGILLILGLLMLFLGVVLAASIEGASRVVTLAGELDLSLPQMPDSDSIGDRILWAIPSVFIIVPSLMLSRLNSPFLILTLCLLFGSIVYIIKAIFYRSVDEDAAGEPTIDSTLPFVLLLVGTAILLSLGPEFVYLRDNFGQRINTLFKFYYQAWVLFGVSALYALSYMLRHYKVSGFLALGVYCLSLAISLLFPFYAIQSRSIEYRGPLDAEARSISTLDGLSYLDRSNPDDYEAIAWLRENVNGTPVIVEAVGGQYSSFGRVSASTGLPTLLGWAGHEYQWRGSTPEPAVRDSAVRTIYETTDINLAKDLLDQYGVSYIVYGSNERNTYNPGGEEKFADSLEVAYRNNGVIIYLYQPDR
jgi:YYY domain-containing protein